MKIVKYLLLALPWMFFTVGLRAQDTLEKSEKFNRWSIGINTMHLYDLRFKAYDDLQNGFSGEDMRALYGEKTKFDLAYGLDASFQFSPVLGVDLFGAQGTMTGANQIEYYRTEARFIGVGSNIALKTGKTSSHVFIPYARFSSGWAGYNATRYFIQDDVDFSNIKGNTFHYGLGLGLKAYLSNTLSVNIQSQFVVVSTDAWDGYNYGSGRDHMLQTSIGIRYTLGSKTHKSLETAPAWQGRTDPGLLEQQAMMNAQLEQLNEKMRVIAHKTDSNEKAIDGINATLLPLLDTVKLNQQIESKIKALSAALTSGKLYVVYFAFNKSDIDVFGRLVLTQLVNHLNSHPDLKIGISAFNDETGNAEVNEVIRDARRNAVKNFLIGAGIEAERMVFEPWTGIYTGNASVDRRAEIKMLP